MMTRHGEEYLFSFLSIFNIPMVIAFKMFILEVFLEKASRANRFVPCKLLTLHRGLFSFPVKNIFYQFWNFSSAIFFKTFIVEKVSIEKGSKKEGLKNPYSQLYHRLSVMFPKEFYINAIPRIPRKAFLEAEKIMIFYLLFSGDMI